MKLKPNEQIADLHNRLLLAHHTIESLNFAFEKGELLKLLDQNNNASPYRGIEHLKVCKRIIHKVKGLILLGEYLLRYCSVPNAQYPRVIYGATGNDKHIIRIAIKQLNHLVIPKLEASLGYTLEANLIDTFKVINESIFMLHAVLNSAIKLLECHFEFE